MTLVIEFAAVGLLPTNIIRLLILLAIDLHSIDYWLCLELSG